PVVDLVPAAELHGPELRVLERIPVDEPLPAERAVAPLDQPQLVLDGMVAREPAGGMEALGDPRLPLGVPELRDPRVDAEAVVEPIEDRVAAPLLRVDDELAERDRPVAGQLGGL